MAKYVLNKNFSLRSFIDLPYVLSKKYDKLVIPIGKDSLEFLKTCDGVSEIDDNNILVDQFTKIYVINEAKNNDKIDEWQKYKVCDNKYVPAIYFQITGKCNYNCLHCFNAKDNSYLNVEMSFEDIKKIIDDASECGVKGFRITGGEPLLHKNIKEIIEYIYEKNMCVFEFNTNGHFLTREFLSIFDKYDFKPQLRISFDGLNFHDFMRGYEGAEKIALDAIKLAKSMNFEILINMNVNKKNISTVIDTLKLFDEMKIDIVRLIRTTEAPRAKDNVNDLIYNFEEYYDVMIKIISDYVKFAKYTELMIWQILSIYPNKKYYNILVSSDEKKYSPDSVICHSLRQMISIGATGKTYPCLEMSGYFDKYNIETDNVKETSLKKILKDSNYLKVATREVCDKIKLNKKCRECKYLKKCKTGCPALSILTSGNMDGEDKSKCILFDKGYEEKFISSLEQMGYKRI